MTSEAEIIALDRFIDSLGSEPAPAVDDPSDASIAGLAETVLELRHDAEPAWPDADFPARAAARIAEAVRGATSAPIDKPPEAAQPQSPNGRALTALATPPAMHSNKRHWFKEFGQIAAAVLALALVASLLAVLFQGRHEQNTIGQNGAVGPQHNGAIIFTSSRTGNDEIYAVEPDGIGLRQLTHDPEMDFGAIWSPDGTKIAFMRGKPVSDGPIPPAARPPISIYVMNADGSDQRNLTPGGNRSFRNLVWSPDGKQLAVECTEKPTDRDGNGQICVLNVDGSGMQRVVPPQLYGQTPVWSPDGRWIAFRGQASSMDQPIVGLYLVSPDGSQQRTVLSDFDVSGSFAWSPDSRQIAYVHGQQSPTLTVVDIADSNTRDLTTDYIGPSTPIWSPDGRQLLLVSSRIDVVNADGSGMRTVVSPEYNVFSAIWSPDGQAIAYTYGVSADRARLDVVGIDGSTPRMLVEEAIEPASSGILDWPPSWQPVH